MTWRCATLSIDCFVFSRARERFAKLSTESAPLIKNVWAARHYSVLMAGEVNGSVMLNFAEQLSIVVFNSSCSRLSGNS